jgi:LacI family transcriptional regulator
VSPQREPRRSGIRDVAERAGVALSSVSRVLSGHPDVSPVMRNRVLDAAAAVGYEPDLLAQSLRKGATMTIGFVVGDISNPLLAQIVLGAETKLRSAGYSMLLTNSVNDSELDAQHIGLLRRRRVDGLLLSLADEAAEETAAALEKAEVPRVLVDRDLPPPGASGAVLSDHAAGITAAAEHLISLGHKRIGLVNGNPRVRPARERERALRRACRRHPGAIAVVRSGSFTAEHGQAATASLLAATEPVTAIIAGGNQILAGVLQALRQAGVQAPSGISLVTCDDVPLSEFLDPPIATITRNPEEMGTVAAEILLEQLHGRTARSAMLPVHFRATASCGPPPR